MLSMEKKPTLLGLYGRKQCPKMEMIITMCLCVCVLVCFITFASCWGQTGMQKQDYMNKNKSQDLRGVSSDRCRLLGGWSSVPRSINYACPNKHTNVVIMEERHKTHPMPVLTTQVLGGGGLHKVWHVQLTLDLSLNMLYCVPVFLCVHVMFVFLTSRIWTFI